MFGIQKHSAERGFTLIETIVTLGIITLLVGATFGVFGLQRSANFDSQNQALLGDLRDMQGKARAVEANQEYGVSFSGNSWSTFSRNPATSTNTTIKTTNLSGSTLSTSITPTASQVIFSRLTGLPANSTNATLTMNLTAPSKSRVIKVDSTGSIYVQ